MPLPDVKRAFILRARSRPAITALTDTRIGGRLRVRSQNDTAGWVMPTRAIVFRIVPGPTPGKPGTTPWRWQPLQWECYGSTMEDATTLFNTFYEEFFPDLPTPQGFIAGGCAVASIKELGAPSEAQENPADFPRIVGTWLAEYAGKTV
jgi:hypothetical protein